MAKIKKGKSSSKNSPKRPAKASKPASKGSSSARPQPKSKVGQKAAKKVAAARAGTSATVKASAKPPLKKSTSAAKKPSVGSKIAIGASGAVIAAASAVAIRTATRGKEKTPTNTPTSSKKISKNFTMPTNSNGTTKEVAPGGGIVQPATKSAPAMRLRADDAEILASAKERYGRKDLEMFRKLLTEQQLEAREEVDILSQNILDTSGEFEADNQTYSLHTAEQGTDAIEREKTFLHAQRTSDYLKKLEEALERIDRGTYGICVVCGGLIEKQRLQAVPITQKHVDCKNRTQVRKVSNGGGFHDVEEQPMNLD